MRSSEATRWVSQSRCSRRRVNGVLVVSDATRVPLYTRTPGFVSLNVRAGLAITDHLVATLALMNALDRNYRVHGSGVDAAGRSVFARVRVSY